MVYICKRVHNILQQVTKELLQKLIKASTLYCGAKVAPWRTYSSPIRTLDLRGAYDELLVIDLLDATVPNMPQLVELRVNDGEYLHFAYAELKHATARVSCASAVNDHRFCSMNPLMPVPASAIDLLACCGTLRLLQVLDRLELDASDTVTRVVERVPLTELRVVSVGGCVSRGVLIGHRDYWQEGRGVCVCVEGCVGWAQGLLAGGLRCVCMCRGVCWLDV